MKRSETRILTTHTGSLPRPADLVEMLGSVSRGEPVDEPAIAKTAREATTVVVRAQAEASIDVINSGGQSRVSFSTYVTQRMSGSAAPGHGGDTATRPIFLPSRAHGW